MASAATSNVKRTQHGDGSVVLVLEQTSAWIKRPAATVLVLVLCGSAPEIGGALFAEIAAAFQPGRRLSLFIDLQQAQGTAVTVESWVGFMTANLGFIERVHVLAMSKATSLAANVIDHFIRKDGLFDIFSEPEKYQDCLARAIGRARPLP